MTKAAQGDLRGILEINKKPLVSKDFNHNKQVQFLMLLKRKLFNHNKHSNIYLKYCYQKNMTGGAGYIRKTCLIKKKK